MSIRICRTWICLVASVVFFAHADVLAQQTQPAEQKIFDAAPFAFAENDAEAQTYGLRWPEPRKVRRVVVQFDTKDALPDSNQVRLQYWHNAWDGTPDPVLAEAGAGGQGWAAMDDWTNGKWKDADTKVQANGHEWTFTFAPSGSKEFKDLGNPGVAYRKTLKIRLKPQVALPKPAKFQAFTDAVVRPLNVRILFGKPADAGIQLSGDDLGTLEAYNGSIENIEILTDEPSANTQPAPNEWTIKGQDGALAVQATMAVDPNDERYDRTIITVRSKYRPFSFAADEIARGDRILVDDLGVLVVRGDDPVTLEGYREIRKELPGRTVYDRVTRHDEQTLKRARDDMPLRRPMEFVHGLPGNRNVMQQLPNGEILIDGYPHWFTRPKSPKDTDHKKWPSDMLQVRFGFPGAELRGGRELKDGYLPLLRSWWQDGPIFYEQRTILDKLGGDLSKIELDDPTVLLVKIRMVNTSASETREAKLSFATAGKRMPHTRNPEPKDDEKLTLDGKHAWAEFEGAKRFRFMVDTDKKGTLAEDDKSLRWSYRLKPGQAQDIYVAVPAITLDEKQIKLLDKHDFEADAKRLCDFWEKLTNEGTQIQTPEPWINGFYKAHIRHMLINSRQELGNDHLLPHVGTFRYGVYANESVMMVSDFDRRGYHDVARRCLDSWIDYQGTVSLPGNFKSKDGLFYGVNEHESGGYNKHHGYVMWCMAEHWRLTRDKEWMEKAAPALIKACDWVINERLGTMKRNADDTLPIEYGFLPAGGLEDVQDFWYWQATNSATVWGFDALAKALGEFGHPEWERIREESVAYHDNVVRGLNESRVRTPVVRLRDGTYVPKYPSDLHTRGRAHGWIRETLEGSIFLPVMDLLAPDAIETKWIMKDYEDNLYISERYGYSIPVFDEFWFSRGGVSMQANLLDSPIPYIKMDEVKHFLRAYFNGFASAFDEEIRMFNEHSLPELGYPSGDHFKTSDEAQSNFWLRLMFVREQGEDLLIGQAIPRYWLEDGQNIGIERSATHFGITSVKYSSSVKSGQIKATFTPPTRNPPKKICVRFRHPQEKPIKSVTVNGKDHSDFDTREEWVILPGDVQGTQEIIAAY